jgi:hypothetical protein
MADEKDEKFDEKSMEKEEEKSTDEKGWDEKWRRDPLSAIIWAAIFIYAGLVLLASNLGLLDNFLIERVEIKGVEFLSDAINAWPLVFIGAGNPVDRSSNSPACTGLSKTGCWYHNLCTDFDRYRTR